MNAMFVCEKLRHFANFLNFYWDELDPAEHTKEREKEELNFKDLQKGCN